MYKRQVIYQHNGNEWTQFAELFASDAIAFDNFGIDVSIHGNYAIVGSSVDKAYIFYFDGSSWVEQAILSGSGYFGRSVDIFGEYAVVGNYNSSGPDGGEVYVFNRVGSTWTEQSQLIASDGTEGNNFGISVELSQDQLIIGTRAGKAYVFKRNGSSWDEQIILSPSDGVETDGFGNPVCINGEYAVVGARDHATNGNTQEGKAYVYKKLSGNSSWYEYARLVTPESGNNVSMFGRGVAISDSAILIGAGVSLSPSFNGKLYFFSK